LLPLGAPIECVSASRVVAAISTGTKLRTGDEVLARQSDSSRDFGARSEGGRMPNFKANQAAFAGKATVFTGLFTTFCVVTDPAMAFVFAVAAFLVLSVTS